MRQRFHTIIKPEPNGWFVGWVEEIPGTITQARTLDACRENLRDALQLMLETHRDEARMPLDATCIQESLDIEVPEPSSVTAHEPAKVASQPGEPHTVG
jgi:predicted RNase H-like HicB family nuclease